MFTGSWEYVWTISASGRRGKECGFWNMGRGIFVFNSIFFYSINFLIHYFWGFGPLLLGNSIILRNFFKEFFMGVFNGG
jgi:hypothetical protein